MLKVLQVIHEKGQLSDESAAKIRNMLDGMVTYILHFFLLCAHKLPDNTGDADNHVAPLVQYYSIVKPICHYDIPIHHCFFQRVS